MKLIDLLNELNKNEVKLQEFDQKVLTRSLTSNDLHKVKSTIESLFNVLHIDIDFTRHFLDRVNDPRNKKQITVQELLKIFRDIFLKYGTRILKYKDDAEAVMKDLSTAINIPFIIHWDNQHKNADIITKTIMRKPDFVTSNPILQVETKKGNLK